MKGQIVTIIEPFQNRTSKAGKPYSAMKVDVLLESNEVAKGLFVFKDLPEGSEVDLEKNEAGYWNVISKEKAQADAQHEEVMQALRAIYKAVTVKETTPAPNPAPAAPTRVTSPTPTWDKVRAEKHGEDTVVTDIPDEIDLNDIPF